MRKLLFVLIASALFGGAGASYYWYVYKGGLDQSTNDVTVHPVFHPMDRFIISLDAPHSSRYLVIQLSLMTHSRSELEEISGATPLMQNILVEYFSDKTRDEAKKIIASVSELQEHLLMEFNKILFSHGFKNSVEKVLITNIFIQ